MKKLLPNFIWPKPDDTAEQEICSDIVEYGCHILTIPEDSEGPTYSFSIGLYLNYQHPEIVVFGLSQQTAGVTINNLCAQIDEGGHFEAGLVTDQIFSGVRASFVAIDSRNYHEFLGSARWFYRCLRDGFPALQLVWSDKLGKFPWESGHSPEAAQFQPVLSNARH